LTVIFFNDSLKTIVTRMSG